MQLGSAQSCLLEWFNATPSVAWNRASRSQSVAQMDMQSSNGASRFKSRLTISFHNDWIVAVDIARVPSAGVLVLLRALPLLERDELLDFL